MRMLMQLLFPLVNLCLLLLHLHPSQSSLPNECLFSPESIKIIKLPKKEEGIVICYHNIMATGRSTALASVSFPSSSCLSSKPKYTSSISMMVNTIITSQRNIACSAVQESSASTVATAEIKEKKEAKPKPKPPPKAPAKPLPQMMEEDVIPSLKSILETQDDISEIELSFGDNRLDGSFLKKNIRYSFWAFFPDGVLTGPKGFSLSSYGSEASTLEPFLIDEKKITAKHVVFWVEKRLAAQGIIPVWRE